MTVSWRQFERCLTISRQNYSVPHKFPLMLDSMILKYVSLHLYINSITILEYWSYVRRSRLQNDQWMRRFLVDSKWIPWLSKSQTKMLTNYKRTLHALGMFQPPKLNERSKRDSHSKRRCKVHHSSRYRDICGVWNAQRSTFPSAKLQKRSTLEISRELSLFPIVQHVFFTLQRLWWLHTLKSYNRLKFWALGTWALHSVSTNVCSHMWDKMWFCTQLPSK